MSSDNSYFLNSATQNLPNAQTQSTSSFSQSSQQGGGGGGGHYNGTTSIAFMDELIKEYLLFRGFNATIKAFEHDLKQDRDRSFRADKITDQLFAYIHAYDLSGLLDYWSYLDNKFFSKITLKLSAYSSSALSRKYELFLLRYYLINAIQTSKTEKAIELFENYASKLQSQSEWKEWYCLPFLKSPEENSVFSVYFNKNWKDAFIASLQNFLNIVFQSVTFPRLLNYDEDSFWNKQIYQRNLSNNMFTSGYFNFEQEYLQSELVDGFQLLQADFQNRQSNNSIISLLKNLATYPAKSSHSYAKTSPMNQSMMMGTSASATSSTEAFLNQNVAKILASRNSVFDYMVRNRAMASQKKSFKSSLSTESRGVETQGSKPSVASEGGSVLANLAVHSVLLNPVNTSGVSTSSGNSKLSETKVQADVAVTEEASKALPRQDSKVSSPKKQPTESVSSLVAENAPSHKEKSSEVTKGHSDSVSKSEPYLMLSQEDYVEHKSAILHCKFSKDGKYVASVDSNSLVKIWSIGNSINTVSTIMQKSSILVIEWDKRFNNILYIGTKSYALKLYDIYQKRIIQDLSFNKLYPLITAISPLASTEKVIILMASKQVQSPRAASNNTNNAREQRNGQMAVCTMNTVNFNLTIEKLVDLDLYFAQCLVNYRSNGVIVGCSDGSLRLYDFKIHEFSLVEKATHANNILNVVLNKSEDTLLSFSSEAVKIWRISTAAHDEHKPFVLTLTSEILAENSVPFFTYDQLIASSNQLADLTNLVDLRLVNATSLIKFDATESHVFVLDKSGVALKDVCLEESSVALGRSCRKLFELEQATAFEVWNASQLCLLLVGGQNGTLRVFKLLHQY